LHDSVVVGEEVERTGGCLLVVSWAVGWHLGREQAVDRTSILGHHVHGRSPCNVHQLIRCILPQRSILDKTPVRTDTGACTWMPMCAHECQCMHMDAHWFGIGARSM
jgi:hypothetical protein